MLDFLIIGQGIGGTLLSWNLIRRGKRVLVVDHPKPNSASKVASGIMNPVTGRRLVSTWMAETLMAAALTEYAAIGNELGKTVIAQKNILMLHASPQMKLAFEERFSEQADFLKNGPLPDWAGHFFHAPFGAGTISPGYLIDLTTLLNGWRNKLIETGSLMEARFDISENKNELRCGGPFRFLIDGTETKTQKVIFCDGAAGADSWLFGKLPYAKNKGEALILSIEGLPSDHIYKQGLTLVPWSEGLWWAGSSYEWDFADIAPSAVFREHAIKQLDQCLKVPYKIVDHLASERPANLERRPFVGFHPAHPNIGLFNGLGTKGCSLAPYFARQFALSMIGGDAILPQADIHRFKRILSMAD